MKTICSTEDSPSDLQNVKNSPEPPTTVMSSKMIFKPTNLIRNEKIQSTATTCIRSQSKLSQPLFDGELRVDDWEPFSKLSVRLNIIDRRRQRRGNVKLTLEFSCIISRSRLARANFFLCAQPYTNVCYQWKFHAVSVCLSRALMVAGKQSVPSAWHGRRRLRSLHL